MLCLLALASAAHAQAVDLVVFGPDPLVAKTKVGVASPKQLAAECAANVTCLAGAGSEAGARRALAITAGGFILVDVADKELIARRDIQLTDRNVRKALQQFLDEAPTERAKALFAIGNRHYELGEYAQALAIYKKAYVHRPLPAFQFNIAQCHRKLGQYREAIAMYQAYLVGVPNAPNAELVGSLIEESKNQLAAAEQAAAEAARLEAEKTKAEAARRAAEADRKAREAEAATEAERRKQVQAKLDAERERELEKTYNRHPARTWMIVSGAVGLATAGAGGYFGIRSRQRQSAFDDANCGSTETLPQATLDRCRDDLDGGRKDARLANILLGTGGAIVAASVLVYIFDPGNIERPKRERASVGVSPGGISVMVQW
jgi:tetratricopeptide (TPR) repeat protein